MLIGNMSIKKSYGKGEMQKTQKVRTNIYLDAYTKLQAKELFQQYHISLSDAINMFLAQSVLSQGLPFDMKIPNKVTAKSMENINNNVDIETISFDDLKREMQERIVR